jgi:hypothetical protein
MSFLKRLFGGGSEASKASDTAVKEIEHNGFRIRATPFKEGGQFQTCGIISKEIGGIVKEYRFIRADRFASLDDAVDVSFKKGKQLIEEQGESIFA